MIGYSQSGDILFAMCYCVISYIQSGDIFLFFGCMIMYNQSEVVLYCLMLCIVCCCYCERDMFISSEWGLMACPKLIVRV